MDYFVYKHLAEEPLPLSSRTMLRFCKHCYSKLWGRWELEDFEDECSIFEQGLRECSWLSKNKRNKEVDEYNHEAHRFAEMKNCPVCGSSLEDEHLYLFDFISIPWQTGQYNMQSIQTYPVDVIARLNPAKGIVPTTEEIGEELNGIIKTPDGIGVNGGTITNKEVLVEFYDDCNFESLITFVDTNIATVIEAKGEEKLRERVEEYENTELSNIHYTINDTEQLKIFLGHLVDIEKNIYTVSERLKTLYSEEYVSSKEIWGAKELELQKVAASANEAENTLRELCAKNPTKGITLEQVKISIPKAPVAPTKPQPPVLETPGFFNKRRVLAENASRTATYENACAHYDEEMQKYEQKLAAHNEKVARLKEEQQQQYQELLEKAKYQHQELIRQQEEKCRKEKEAVDAARDTQSTTLTPKAVSLQCVQDEIQQAEDLLKKLYAARQQMYMSGVIFDKYHNFVAVSSFYDYLCSGRCTSLDGAVGAYSIYENEIRMNAVIAQLTQVVERLDALEQNQYVLYSAIADANRQLNTLNSSMKTMNTALAKINTKLTNIEKNTEIIAYNSEVTAFYTKKNAELTNALGYLIALS